MKIKVLIAALLLILTVGFVSASDENMTFDDLTVYENLDNPSSDEFSNDRNIGNFSQLSHLIENSSPTLELDKDYANTGFEDEITISKSIIIDGKGHHLDATKTSGIFHIESNNVTLKNIVFKNGNSEYGCAIKFNANNGIIDNCSFISCSTKYDGEAISYSHCSNNTLNNCNFINSYTCDGSAIHFYDCDNNSLTNCSFKNCSTKYDGGAISYSHCSNNTLNNCNFTNCYACNGGAIDFYECANNSLTNCSFKNCYINNIEYENGASYGGAVYFDYSSNNKLNHCSFIDCSMKEPKYEYWGSFGGAIHFLCSSQNNLTNCSFKNCSVENGGGAISYDDCRNNTLNDCNFINCSSYGAGAIDFNGCDMNILNNCCFINCKAINSGAILFNQKYEVNDGGHGENKGCTNSNINNCSFINCYSDDEGGAIIFYGNNGKITNCYFINCKSKKGGAIYFYDYYEQQGYWYSPFEKAIVSNCNFMNCSSEYGGSIYVGADSHYTTVRNCSFLNSKANIGGSIYWIGEGGKILASNFSKSHAKNGGAVYSDKNSGLKISDSTFTDNTATKYGSAVYGVTPSKSSYSGNSKPEIHKTYYPAIKASNAKVLYNSGKTYTVKVYKNTDVPANYAKIVIKANGKTFKTLYTNNNGIGKFKLTQKPGTYKLKITSLGKSISKTLTIKHIVTLKNVKVKKSAKKLTLQANLAKINGKYLKNKQIAFKFNGKTYKTKTNSKGIAKVTIKSSVLKKLKAGKKVTYQATYLKDTVKKTVKIQK